MSFKLRASGGNAALCDSVQISRALDLFLDPEHYVFLQGLPSAIYTCLRCDDLEAIGKWISERSSENGIYFGINPIGTKLDRPSRVGDVAYRRWILIDIDRNKTIEPDNPATDYEHDDAGELTYEVMSYLSEVGFPAPVQIDSANGYHLYYYISFPNDVEHRDLVHNFLKHLATKFDGDKGKIGAECFDSRRISRIPGTWSRRGSASLDRPYRICKFVSQPKHILEVPAELIRQVIENKIVEAPASPTPWQLVAANGSPDRIQAYGQRALDIECAKLASAPVGERNNQLFKSTAALFQLVAAGAIDAMTVKDAMTIAASQCGLTNEKEVYKTIESAKAAGLSQPRILPEKLHEANGKPVKPPADLPERIVLFADEVMPRKIQWLWAGRIPLGKLTTFAGAGGLGKTFVLTDIAARVTTGMEWPDGSAGNTPGKVLYISGEDDPEDTLVPRLIAAGGVRSMVAYFKPEVLGQFNLERLDILDIAIVQMGADCRLVCIDPPTSFLGEADDHKNSELRKLLTPLSEWATRHKVAVIFITHINKGGAGKVDAVMRIIGSVAWSNAVRAAHMFARDPEDPERRIFIGVKINGAKERPGLAYRLRQIDETETDGVAMVEWCGSVDTTANEAMAGQSRGQSRAAHAADWLREKFVEKLEWESEELFRDSRNAGISRSAVFEAKRDLNLPKARKTTFENGTSTWIWWVPPDWEGFKWFDAQKNVEPLESLENRTTEAIDY